MAEPIPVTVTVTETHRFEIDPEWFDDRLGADATQEELWEAVREWNAKDPGDLWAWVEAEPEASQIVLVRDDTGDQITDAEPA